MQVAVKFMNPLLAATPEWRARFEREARAVAAIQSRNVVHVHDYGLHEGTPYMVMELLQGEVLSARLERERRLPPFVVAGVLAQVGKALRQAHERGIVHRDLKPSNIFLTRDDDEEVVKVFDFGVVKRTGLEATDERTHTGLIIGSVHYMSPEQARGARDLDHRTDLWAMAVVAYRALTGYLPFPGDQAGDVIVKICSETPWPPSAFAPELGPAVDAFFARAFARRPEDRYASARELADAFSVSAGAPTTTSTALPRMGSMTDVPSPNALVPSVPLGALRSSPSLPRVAEGPPTISTTLRLGPEASATAADTSITTARPVFPAPLTGTITGTAVHARDAAAASHRSVVAVTAVASLLLLGGGVATVILYTGAIHPSTSSVAASAGVGADPAPDAVAPKSSPAAPSVVAAPPASAVEPPAPSAMPVPKASGKSAEGSGPPKGGSRKRINKELGF
jgi:serine/threonine-protein kinase